MSDSSSSTLLRDTCRAILMQAVQHDVGIEVSGMAMTPVAGLSMRMKQSLYRFKSEDATFRNIQIVFSPDEPENTVWLINRPEPEQ